jgi:hypothetical protein
LPLKEAKVERGERKDVEVERKEKAERKGLKL